MIYLADENETGSRKPIELAGLGEVEGKVLEILGEIDRGGAGLLYIWRVRFHLWLMGAQQSLYPDFFITSAAKRLSPNRPRDVARYALAHPPYWDTDYKF